MYPKYQIKDDYLYIQLSEIEIEATPLKFLTDEDKAYVYEQIQRAGGF